MLIGVEDRWLGLIQYGDEEDSEWGSDKYGLLRNDEQVFGHIAMPGCVVQRSDRQATNERKVRKTKRQRRGERRTYFLSTRLCRVSRYHVRMSGRTRVIAHLMLDKATSASQLGRDPLSSTLIRIPGSSPSITISLEQAILMVSGIHAALGCGEIKLAATHDASNGAQCRGNGIIRHLIVGVCSVSAGL